MSNYLDPKDPHYMTPGAREQFDRYRTRTTAAFVILAVAFIVGVWGLTERTDKNIRRDINKISQESCVGSIPTLNKFNNLVQIQIQSNRNFREIYMKEGNFNRVKVSTNNIVKLQETKLDVPTIKECRQRVIIQE